MNALIKKIYVNYIINMTIKISAYRLEDALLHTRYLS